MKSIMENRTKEISFWDHKDQAAYVDTWFLMSSPYPGFLVVSAYLLFVLKVGPAYMSGRPPMKLKNVLLAYNVIQVLMSVFLVYTGFAKIRRYGLFHRTCWFQQEDLRKDILSGSYWYFFAKVTELLDTVFFVLRKKQNQVSFLHVYHHTFVVVTSWALVKYGKTDDLIFCGTLNSFVHILMYGYYALSVFPELEKYLWWKKHLTALQLIQFVLVLIQIPTNTVISNCPPSHLIIWFTLMNGSLFLYLFSNFYKKAYVKKDKSKPELNHKKDLNKNGHDNACTSFVDHKQPKWKR